MFSLQKKNILVTGASSGIGKEVAKVLSDNGANVIITARNKERLIHSYQCLNSSNHNSYFVCDLTSDVDITNLTRSIDNIDGIVHCAGIGKYVPLKFYNRDLLLEFYNTNVFAPFLLTNEIVKKRKLNKEASVVLISSVMSVVGAKANTIYGSTKGALVAGLKSMALELASKKIRINSISPALVETPLLNADKDKGGISNKEYEDDLKKHPMGIGTPNDIANLCLFLLSDESRWITGTNIIIDGGYTLS